MNPSILHTEFIVHWTGKDFHNPPCSELTEKIRKKYINRLFDTLINGLYMKEGDETVYGTEKTWVTAGIARTCFTEIKLSQAEPHAERYGRLGIGFHRTFIMERYGNPVFYVQNGNNSKVVQNLHKIRDSLKNNKKKLKEFEHILGFVKNMSERDSYRLKYYDEMEWRIVHLDILKEEKKIKEEEKDEPYRIILKPGDIKLIVFPDEDTKKMALNENSWEDPEIKAFLKPDTTPIMLTLEDCKHF